MNRTFLVIALIAFAVIVIVALVGILGVGRVQAPPVAGSIEVWGIGDSENIWQDLINRFQAAYPSISVTYRRFDEAGYEDMLVNRLAEGKGPDVFFLSHTAVVKHRDKIFPLPAEAGFSITDFKNTFVDAAADDLISGNEILGMPISMDTLALFINKDIFNAAGIATPPKTWDDLAATARALTVRGPGGDITASGIALGAAQNIERSFEIVSALMLQRKGIAVHPVGTVSFGPGAADALSFYASFSDPLKQNYSWDKNMPDSLDAFSRGQTAMMIGFSGDSARIRERNPHLNFTIHPLPQNAGAGISVNWGKYFFPAVSTQSKNKQAAWQFIVFASSREGAKSYLEATGRPPARRDLVAAGTRSEDLSVFWRQSLTARSWLVPDDMATRRLFAEAIDAVLSHSADPAGAVSRLESQLRLLAP